ncbi:MAG: SH3 domain-containing protein, partial [Oscillospiraceae bacterium]|nr:SH3 domain-containing protein [Oscillospiraceae bacterium]
GYMKSEYLIPAAADIEEADDITALPAVPVAAVLPPDGEEQGLPEDEPREEAGAAYKTTTRVNFRTGASLEAAVIKTLNPGVTMDVLEYDAENWSKVLIDGVTGYIKSEYIISADKYEGVTAGGVEMLEWKSVKGILPLHRALLITDVRTKLTYTVQSFSNGLHADVEPLTKADTAVLLKTYGGKWKWDPRPVWVTFNGRTFAASINGMPHGGGTISGNGMNGQVCLHFLGSKPHNGNKAFERDHQAGVKEAYNAAK